MIPQLPQAKINQDYVKFGGGLDLVTPVLSMDPGACLNAMNYEPDIYGGYRRIDGYERFDGHTSPSSATYYYLSYNPIGSFIVGDTVTGVTSSATGVICYIGAGDFAITKLSGTFVEGETILVLGSTVGVLTSTAQARGYSDGEIDATALSGAADIYRLDIAALPGSGSTIGGFVLRGVTYGIRNNAGGTAAVLYKSTTAGWVAIDLGRELPFTSGGTYEMKVGDTITGAASGATAVITRVSLQSGSYAGGTAVGVINFLTQTGTFAAENLNVGANLNVATIAGDSSAITMAPNGRLETVNYNFYASTDTLRTYGADGVNKAFEFDGTTFSRITTGMTVDTPTHVLAANLMLFLSFNGSLQNSGTGNPQSWTALTGASELGIGDTITNLAASPGGSVLITARNKTSLLTGTSIDDFVLSSISDNIGAIPYTLQTFTPQAAQDAVLFLDDAGVAQLNRTNAYGNYLGGYISDMVRSVIDSLHTKAIASLVYKNRKQYRVFGNDGSGIVLALLPTSSGTKAAVTQLQYPHNVRCSFSGEDSTGKDIVFFGDDNGYIYQLDKGSSFDGQQIEAYLRMPFNNTKTPRYRKRYRKAVMEMSANGFVSIKFAPEFNYGDVDIATHKILDGIVQGLGGYWDDAVWNVFYWDARTVASPEFDVNGTGINISMLFYSKSKIDIGHVLQGVIFHYTLRRLQR